MDHHLADAERVGDQAGMLAAGAAETLQRVAGHVVAARDRDLLDRIGHVVDRDRGEALATAGARLAGARGDLARQRVEPRRPPRVERLVARPARTRAGKCRAGSCRARRCSR